MNKQSKLDRKQKHLEELQAIGYTGRTLIPLVRIEHEAHRIAEAYCNGELSEIEYSAREMRFSNRVAVLFGGVLPLGFFINGDPRGYALKLDNDINTDKPISYTDFGGYMILAPEFKG